MPPKSIQLSPFQLIVFFYFSTVTLSAILLSLPVAHKPETEWSFIDALFTAVSAVSVTGLTVVSTADTFSTTGIFLLAIVLQIGGVGIMALSTLVWLLFGKKIGLKERQLIMADQNRMALAGLVRLMKQILILILLIELIGTLILGTYFLTVFPTWQEAFYHAFFAAVSATTNAGFDITGASLEPFAHDYFVQFIVILLIILGSIGFPVLIEVKDFLMNKKSDLPYRFSLFTKLTTVTFFSLVAVGFLLILFLELNHFFKGQTWHEVLFFSLFQSVTTRSAGLSTMDVGEFSEATQLVLSFLMFIGASPSSTGGGIRTTTFAIILLAIFFFAKGNESIKVFNREIHHEDIIKAFVVLSVAILLCATAVVMLALMEDLPLISIIFEVSSAFGTCGLSMGITDDLSTTGKTIIMFLMFFGRVGLVPLLFLIRGKGVSDKYHYPKERVIIG